MTQAQLRLGRHGPARVEGDGVLFGLWFSARYVPCFVTAPALEVVAEARLSPAQWLVAYRRYVRRIQAVARDTLAYRSDSSELVVLHATAFSEAAKPERAVGGSARARSSWQRPPR